MPPEANTSNITFPDACWDLSYSASSHPEGPATKKVKTSGPQSVICCDQPCPPDDICYQDYLCHEFCTDACQDPCLDLCHDPCQQACPDPCTPECHEAASHHHDDCPDLCTADCEEGCSLDHCDADCGTLCTSLDNCIDPSTACLDSCDWCNHNLPQDCLDCLSTPAVSDVPTPQLQDSWNPLLLDNGKFNFQTTLPGHSHTHSFSAHPSDSNDSLHICRAIGCTAGAFTDEDALQDHIEKNHLLKVDDRYVCQWEGCVKRVTKKSNDFIAREKAARAIGKTYIPPSEPFSDEHLHKLKRHYYVHSGKKSFECPTCRSVHATKAQLKVHMARHSPKVFRCDECDKVFTTQNQLKTHVNAVHKKEKHFRCPDCDYACDDSSNMSSHKRKQHVAGVQCPNHIYGCAYRDGRQGDMEKHMRAAGHGSWMVDEKDAYDVWWKKEKRAVEDERWREESMEGTTSKSSRKTAGRRSTKGGTGHSRKCSMATTVVHEKDIGAQETEAAPFGQTSDMGLGLEQFAMMMGDNTFPQYTFPGL